MKEFSIFDKLTVVLTARCYETRRDGSKLKSRDETRRTRRDFQNPRRETRRETSCLVSSRFLWDETVFVSKYLGFLPRRDEETWKPETRDETRDVSFFRDETWDVSRPFSSRDLETSRRCLVSLSTLVNSRYPARQIVSVLWTVSSSSRRPAANL